MVLFYYQFIISIHCVGEKGVEPDHYTVFKNNEMIQIFVHGVLIRSNMVMELYLDKF